MLFFKSTSIVLLGIVITGLMRLTGIIVVRPQFVLIMKIVDLTCIALWIISFVISIYISYLTTVKKQLTSNLPIRCRFAFLPVPFYEQEFYQNKSRWLVFVNERKTPSGWKVMRYDN